MLIAQADAYRYKKKRLYIARALVEAAIANMLRNLRYYQNRGKDQLQQCTMQLEVLASGLEKAMDINQLMGMEGNARQVYYTGFAEIIDTFTWHGRQKKPPTDEINALISFGNALCYTVCLDAIYNSQLNPTLSYLHEPGTRRYSLAFRNFQATVSRQTDFQALQSPGNQSRTF